MSDLARLKALKVDIDGASDVDSLRTAVGSALVVPEPKGNPGRLQDDAATLSKASRGVGGVHTDVVNVASRGLPNAWVGATRERASDVITASAQAIDDTFNVFGWAAQRLDLLADDLAGAKKQHGSGHFLLTHALALLGSPLVLTPGVDPATLLHAQQSKDAEMLAKARPPAEQGIQLLVDAAVLADQASTHFARAFNGLAAEAKASRLSAPGLTAADRVVLGEAASPGKFSIGTILSDGDMARATAAMKKLSADEQTRLNDLLKTCKSPQERAYLLKALAAGHSLDEVAGFDKLIHQHADDPSWLRDRLSPGDTGAWSHHRSWTQGSQPTCVASSTVLARAVVDPLYALRMTTGGHPGNPRFDNANAFTKRIADEQMRVYDLGRRGRQWGGAGMYDYEGNRVFDSQIGTHTGQSYKTVVLDSTAERRRALERIYTAVEGGNPVPVGVHGHGDYHEIVVIGHQGNVLQVYNPWGYTTWVSPDDFVNNHMNTAAFLGPDQHLQHMTTVDTVHLPR